MTENYLLLGPEKGEKTTFIEKIISNLKAKHGEVEIYKLYLADLSLSDFSSKAESGNLFSSSEIYILNQAESLNTVKDIKIIEDVLKNSGAGKTFIFISETFHVHNNLKKLIPEKNTKIFWELNYGRKKDFVRTVFHRQNVKIEEEAVELLIELVEGNTEELEKECNRIRLVYPEKTEILCDDIEEFIFHSKEESVFTLFNKFISSGCESALFCLQKIFLSKESNSVALIQGLLWQFKQAWQFKALDSEFPSEQAFRESGVRSKKGKELITHFFNKYNLEELKKLLKALYNLDREVRINPPELQYILLQHFILMYCK